MLRVAVFQVSALLGGSDRSLLDLLKIAHAKLFEATVILPKFGPLCSYLTSLGVPWVVVKQPKAVLSQSRSFRLSCLPDLFTLPFLVPAYLRQLAIAIRKISPNIIYTNGIKAHLLSTFLRPILNLPTVWHLREHWGGQFAGHMADYGPELIIANSLSTAKFLQKYMKRQEKVIVIDSPIDVGEFSPDGPIAETGETGKHSLKVGLPGVLVRLKGHELLLRAAVIIRNEFLPVNFFFIGGEIYDTIAGRGCEKELRESIKEKSLTNCVFITGFQKVMGPWYRAMDVVVNASVKPEGFGRTLLEAMACGKAVVGPNAGGIPEFVTHNENGLLYKMGDSRALAKAILRLLHDPVLRNRLGAAGRETALQHSALEPHADAISKALYNIVK